MSTDKEQLEAAKVAILLALQDPDPPSSAVELKVRLKKLPWSVVQAAMWDLLDAGRVKLTLDRKMKVVESS